MPLRRKKQLIDRCCISGVVILAGSPLILSIRRPCYHAEHCGNSSYHDERGLVETVPLDKQYFIMFFPGALSVQ